MPSSTIAMKCGIFNCQGLKSSFKHILDLTSSHDILFINEHWLQVHELYQIEEICESYKLKCFNKSSVDPAAELRGRPHGGVGFKCKQSDSTVYRPIGPYARTQTIS